MPVNYFSKSKRKDLSVKDGNDLDKVESDLKTVETQLDSLQADSPERDDVFHQLIPLQRKRMKILHALLRRPDKIKR